MASVKTGKFLSVHEGDILEKLFGRETYTTMPARDRFCDLLENRNAQLLAVSSRQGQVIRQRMFTSSRRNQLKKSLATRSASTAEAECSEQTTRDNACCSAFNLTCGATVKNFFQRGFFGPRGSAS